jgi:3-methyladenine DNA glycosylase/8-oxoguanine DNA glycosylase
MSHIRSLCSHTAVRDRRPFFRENIMTLRYDPDAATAHLRAADPVIAREIDAVGPLQIRHGGDPYGQLVRAILYQQLAGPAAATIERRFLALYGNDGAVPTPEQLLATDLETLRSAGVSRQKGGYLLDLAAKAQAGVIGDFLAELPDDDVIAHVTQVKGIGRWTADMLLMFCLGRPDVLPVGDLGFKNAVMRLYGHDEHLTVAELEALAVPWRPYRSAATWYLWQWLDVKVPEG